jgi:Polyphosphate kinase 2 (PPK2)
VIIKRYVAQLPAAGEIVLFDRSWYDGKDRQAVGEPDPLIVGAPGSLNEYREQDLPPTPSPRPAAEPMDRVY